MSFHVVVGAGATGTETALRFATEGQSVRLITRRGTGPEHPLVERIAADATDPVALTGLAEGARTLINCAAPSYDRWVAEFPALAAALLTAAERTGAGYVMLGNAYGYGLVSGPITPDLPLAATTRKGRVRARMWLDAHAAYQSGRVRVAEVRASDFLGAGAYSPYNLLVTPLVLAGEEAPYPADLDAPHTWSSIADVARTLIAVALSEQGWGRAWHVPSVSTSSARELTARLAEIAGAPAPRLTSMSADELEWIGQGDPVIAELAEMRYLYDRPFLLDSADTERVFDLKPSALDDALHDMALTVGRP